MAPSGVGGERCMKIAMAMADKIGGEKEVGYVNTHGTSTPVGDVQELGAVNRVFTEKGYQPFVGSTKSMSLGRSSQECWFFQSRRPSDAILMIYVEVVFNELPKF